MRPETAMQPTPEYQMGANWAIEIHSARIVELLLVQAVDLGSEDALSRPAPTHLPRSMFTFIADPLHHVSGRAWRP